MWQNRRRQSLVRDKGLYWIAVVSADTVRITTHDSERGGTPENCNIEDKNLSDSIVDGQTPSKFRYTLINNF